MSNNDHAVPAGASLRVFSKRDLESLDYRLDEVLSTVEGAYRAYAAGRSANPSKLTAKPDDGHSVAYAMLGRDGERETVAIKTSYKYGPESDKADQRYYTSLLMYDDRSGLPIAMMDCSLIGSLRTPAATALIARACAPSNATTALVVGCGVQGQMALPFLVQAMPQLERLIVHGHHASGIDAVLSRMHHHHPMRRIEVSKNLEQSATQADIVIGAAGPSSSETVASEWLRPGSLAVLVGYGLAKDALHLADYRVATNEGQMRITGTDLQLDDRTPLPAVDAEMPQILAGLKPARRHAADRVFAYNSGMVITDIALGRLFAERAASQGLGQSVEMW